MTQKNKRTMWIMLGIVVILAAAYAGILFWNKSSEEKKSAEAEAEKIYVTDLEDVTGIRYDVGNGALEFVKEEDQWYDKEDRDFPLTQSYPEQIAETFGRLEADRKLEDGDSLEDYGLDEPVYTVVLTDGDGNETSLYLGNTTGEDYYMTLQDKTEIYTVSSDVISDLQYTLEDMAKLDTMPSVGSANLKKAVITKGTDTVTYDSENEDDSEAIAQVAGGIGAAALSDAADYSVEDVDLSGYGLDEASRTTMTVTYTDDDEEKELTLYFGKEDGEGGRYMMLNDSRIVYILDTEVCSNILNEDSDS